MPDERQQAVRIPMMYADNANFHCNANAFHFQLMFADSRPIMGAAMEMEEGNKEVGVPLNKVPHVIVGQFIMPPTAFKAMAEMMCIMVARYEEVYGEILCVREGPPDVDIEVSGDFTEATIQGNIESIMGPFPSNPDIEGDEEDEQEGEDPGEEEPPDVV